MSIISKYVQVGDKVKINKNTHSHLKPASLSGLYTEGDILTVKTLGSLYPYSGNVHYIKEVEEFATPEGIEALLLPIEWDVVSRTTESSKRMMDFK